jgi:hypothetical protein
MAETQRAISGSLTTPALGTRFVDALANKDAERLAAVLHPQVDFRGLTRRHDRVDAGRALRQAPLN